MPRNLDPKVIENLRKANIEVTYALRAREERIAIERRRLHFEGKIVVYPFVDELHLQHRIYAKYQLQSFSILSQIDEQFFQALKGRREAFKRCRGLIFIDFDNTIFNSDLYLEMYQKHIRSGLPYQQFTFNDYSQFYNGASREEWQDIISGFVDNKYLVISFTSRSIGVEEDEPIQQIIYRDFFQYFHCHLFLNHIGTKGAVIHHIKKYIVEKHGIHFNKRNTYLVDDDVSHLVSALDYAIPIRSFAACQRPSPNFIHQLRQISQPFPETSAAAAVVPVSQPLRVPPPALLVMSQSAVSVSQPLQVPPPALPLMSQSAVSAGMVPSFNSTATDSPPLSTLAHLLHQSTESAPTPRTGVHSEKVPRFPQPASALLPRAPQWPSQAAPPPYAPPARASSALAAPSRPPLLPSNSSLLPPWLLPKTAAGVVAVSQNARVAATALSRLVGGFFRSTTTFPDDPTAVESEADDDVVVLPLVNP